MKYLEKLQKIKKQIILNNYKISSEDNFEFKQEENFLYICKDLNLIIENIQNELNLKNNLSSIKELQSRKRFIHEIYDELENSYIPNGNGGDIIEFTTRYSCLTEMVNNAAHIVDMYVNENKMNKKQAKEFKDIRNELFKIKNVSIEKIAKNAIGKEKDGVIIGIAEDTTKYENANVFVVDLPYKGQLSWHVNLDESSDSYITKVPKYKYKLEKSVTDSKEKVLNSKLLLEYGRNNEHNVHNRIVKNIPYDNENELEAALYIYYEVINNKDEYECVENKLISACKKHKMISKETFNMLLDEMMDTLYLDKEYDRNNLEKWRDNYENRGK